MALSIAAIGASMIPLLSQMPAGQRPSFEVASIKLTASEREDGSASRRIAYRHCLTDYNTQQKFIEEFDLIF
jgi:hypothetical protein